MSNALQKSVQKLRGQRVRVIGNDGRKYVGWLERIGNGGHLVLRDAWDSDADERVDPAHVRAPKSVVGVEPDSRVERVAVDEISPAPYHAREFDASENRRYTEQVRDDGWTGSFPVARETDDDLEDEPQTVECAHCGEDVPEDAIVDHHTTEHPNQRYDPIWYTREADTDE